MAHETEKAAMLILFRRLAESGTFNTAAGSAISCLCYVERDVNFQPPGFEAQAWQTGTTVECLLDQLGREPNRNETFTVGAETFTVQSILSNDKVFFVKSVVK